MSISYKNKKTLGDLNLTQYKKAVVRLDLNVPIDKKTLAITDKHRITQALPTVKKLLDSKLKVIILSHISRIKSLDDIKSGAKSMSIVAKELQNQLSDKKVVFIPSFDNFEEVRGAINNQPEADVYVLENTRYYDIDTSGNIVKRESKNDPDLAKFWASLGDVFINDAFGTCHRSHASNVGIAGFLPSAIGLLVEKELQFLSKAVESNDHPKVLILGGSKVSDKLKLINAITPQVDRVLVGGGMVYTFLKAMGKPVGKSIVEEDMIEECKDMLNKYKDKLVLPVDHLVAPVFQDIPGEVKGVDEAGWDDQMALDIGPESANIYASKLDDARVVIWNGPMGVFEFDNFASGTAVIALKLAEITKKGAYTVIGGGDSAAAVLKFDLSSQMSFISTGGGASLTFFEGAPMPGIECISDK